MNKTKNIAMKLTKAEKILLARIRDAGGSSVIGTLNPGRYSASSDGATVNRLVRKGVVTRDRARPVKQSDGSYLNRRSMDVVSIVDKGMVRALVATLPAAIGGAA